METAIPKKIRKQMQAIVTYTKEHLKNDDKGIEFYNKLKENIDNIEQFKNIIIEFTYYIPLFHNHFHHMNLIDGEYISYHDNGKPSRKFTVVNGKLHGEYLSLHDNGQVWEKCNYVNGEYDGEFSLCDFDGNVILYKLFDAGDLIVDRMFTHKGKLMCEVFYRK